MVGNLCYRAAMPGDHLHLDTFKKAARWLGYARRNKRLRKVAKQKPIEQHL
jgi:hypothetical protein